MNNARKNLLSRIHQLTANDQNAADIYGSLSKSVNNKEIADQFAALAREEAGHLALDKELIKLLEEVNPE